MEEKLNAALETIRRVEDHIAGIDRDMEKDRQGLQDLNLKVGSLVAEVGELRRAINLNAERTRDKVAEVVEPVITSNSELREEVKKAKKKDLVFISSGKKWWEKLFGRGGDKNAK